MPEGEASPVRSAAVTDDQEQWRQAVPGAMLGTPFISGLGLRVERYEPDDVEVRLPFRQDLTNDGARYHGGVVAAVLDTAGALAAWSNHDFSRGTQASTVSMTVQYVRACVRSDMRCSARTVRRARELVFTDITATDDGGAAVAHAVQVYRIA